MFNEKIKELEASISGLTATIATKTAKIKALLGEEKLEEARAIKTEVEAHRTELSEAKADLELFKASLAESKGAEAKAHEVATDEMSYLEKAEAYIRSKGAIAHDGLRFGETRDEVLIPMNDITPADDGVKKVHTKPVTSEEISYNPTREVKTTVDLKQFASIHKANKAAGKYPILKKATSKMVSVAELEKNPALAKPEFDNVTWEVATYRGAIPVSQESIDDADVDILAIVAENAAQIKTNTTNSAIATVLKSFEAKTVANLDDLKAIVNVALDPAYDVSFVVSQSFYQILDTLKDGNGRYLLQDSIISASGKVFNGKPVYVIPDTEFGKAGEAKAFVGDFKRGVLFVDRKDLGLRWADNEIYGQYLQAVVRFDVKQADAKAGFFVTYTP